MKRLLFTFLLLSFLASGSLKAQGVYERDSVEVMQVIQDVFDGMRAGDSSMISKHLLESVIMHTVGLGPNGQTKIFTDSKPEAWLEAVAKPKEQVWDERTSNFKLHITEGLASVWMDYSFYIDETLSHCGVNSFQLVKSDGKWKIIYIIDTRKRAGCNI